LTPSTFISQNEIDAAKTVRMEYQNTQGQPKFVWRGRSARAGVCRSAGAVDTG
jgi:hypothetical protein